MKFIELFSLISSLSISQEIKNLETENYGDAELLEIFTRKLWSDYSNIPPKYYDSYSKSEKLYYNQTYVY